MKTALELIILLPLLGAIFNILLGRVLSRRVVESIACAVIWGSFVAALFAAGSYSGPSVVEVGSWLSCFDLKAPISLYLRPALAVALPDDHLCLRADTPLFHWLHAG